MKRSQAPRNEVFRQYEQADDALLEGSKTIQPFPCAADS
jgi:hypothetical protein